MILVVKEMYIVSDIEFDLSRSNSVMYRDMMNQGPSKTDIHSLNNLKKNSCHESSFLDRANRMYV